MLRLASESPAGLKRMAVLRSAGLLLLLLGATICVTRAQYEDYQGTGASRGYDGEYDYAEGEDDYDEEDYNTDLAAQSYDYEEQIQGDECVHDNGETQVPGSLNGCEFRITGSDRIFQDNIESLDGIYMLEGCRKGYPFYLRKNSPDQAEPRMLWFHPDFKDWVVSNTDDKSLAGKSRYWMAYSDEEADRVVLPSTTWHASRDLSVATDDFYTNFDVDCVKTEQGLERITQDGADYGPESADSQPADMIQEQENKEMQDDDAEDWDEYENIEEQRGEDGDPASAEGHAPEDDDMEMYEHPEEDLADATENDWDESDQGEADENLMKIGQVGEINEDDLSQQLDMKLREAEKNVDEEEEDMEDWVEYDFETEGRLEEAEDADEGDADEEEWDQYEDNAEERLVEALEDQLEEADEEDDEQDVATMDWHSNAYENADKLAEPGEDEEEWTEYENDMEGQLALEEAEEEIEEAYDEEWAEYEEAMEEQLDEEFEKRLEEADEEIKEADEEEWAEYEDEMEEELELEEAGEEEWDEYDEEIEGKLDEEFETRLEDAEEEVAEEGEDDEWAEYEDKMEQQLDEEFEERLQEAEEEIEEEADEDHQIYDETDDLGADGDGEYALEDEYDLLEGELGNDFTQEQQELEEELEHTENRLENDYTQLMAAEAASVDAPYNDAEDRIEEYEDKVEEEYEELLEEMFERELEKEPKEPEDAEEDTAKNSGAMPPVADGEEDAWGEYEAEKAAGDDWPSLKIDSASTFPSKGHVTIIGGVLLIILGIGMYSVYSCFTPSSDKSNRRHYERFSDSRRRTFDLEDGDVEEKLR